MLSFGFKKKSQPLNPEKGINQIMLEVRFAAQVYNELRAERLNIASQLPQTKVNLKAVQDSLTRQRLLSELHKSLDMNLDSTRFATHNVE